MPVRKRPIEWPTVILASVIHGGWLALTYATPTLPWWIASPAGAWLIAWHSSLQHEVLHGHPTRWSAVNHAIAIVPLSLWLPYALYRETHLRHHTDDRLTDPLDDPESYYWTAASWSALGPVGRALVRAQTTLAGRIVIGPFWNILRFLRSEARACCGSAESRRLWAWHGVACLPVLFWLIVICDVSITFYVFAMIIPGTALLGIRSFAEHRWSDDVARRTALVEGAWVLGPLFLFNNLHAAHHAAPGVPWFRLPAWAAANRAQLVAANGGLVYRGYGDVARRFWRRAHDRPLHPGG